MPFPPPPAPKKLTSKTASGPKAAHLNRHAKPGERPKSAHLATPVVPGSLPQESSPQPTPEDRHWTEPGRPVASAVACRVPAAKSLGKAFDGPRKRPRQASAQEHIHSPAGPKALTSNVSAGHIHSPQAPQRLTQVPKAAHPASEKSFTDKHLAARQSSRIQFRYFKLFKAADPESRKRKPKPRARYFRTGCQVRTVDLSALIAHSRCPLFPEPP